MNDTHAALAAHPRPADAADCGVAQDAAGWHVVWLRNGGLTKEPTPPRFATAKAAAAASRWLRDAAGLGR
jgi:hypothetical protein